MSKQILVVDDEVALARLVQINLQREGHEARIAHDGAEALDAIAAGKPDLVILDVVMPKLDGFEVLQRLKADPETADIPVIMLTGRSDDESILKGWTGGVLFYMTKPFDPLDLLAMVSRAFGTERE
ncbi:MAG: response regulator [Armatimonadetes bacterium]|nr:response regulator [Armatimonadota bacterium]